MLRSLTTHRTVHTSALLGLLLAACGGGGSSGTDPTTTSSTTSVTPVTPTTSAQPTTSTTGPAVTPPVNPTGPTGPTGGPTGPTGPTGGPTGPTGGPTGPTGTTSEPPDTTTGPTASTGSTDTSAPPDDTGAPPSGDANPSGLMEPGDGGVARPSGTAGNLVVLPWAGYAGAVTYSFDDSNSSQYSGDHGAKFLAHGVPFTWYLQTNKGTAGKEFYEQARDAGHELGNHTEAHATSSNTAAQDVEKAQAFIKSTYQVDAYTMASPNGDSAKYTTIAPTLFIIDRGVSDGLIGPDDNPNLMDLPSLIPSAGTAGINQLGPKVDAAESQKKWQTFCIHGFEGGNDGAYNALPFEPLMEHIEYAKTKNVWIGTMVDVGAYFIGRKLVKAATAQDGVYTWNLPDVFPPGKYVRVTVDGGTLSQKGTPLPWNEHGFYEVALDAEELTLTP